MRQDSGARCVTAGKEWRVGKDTQGSQSNFSIFTSGTAGIYDITDIADRGLFDTGLFQMEWYKGSRNDFRRDREFCCCLSGSFLLAFHEKYSLVFGSYIVYAASNRTASGSDVKWTI